MLGRIMALDHGSVRVGIALSDELRMIATGRKVLPAGPPEELLETLVSYAEENGVTAVVVGMPLHMDGSHGESAVKAQTFVGQLSDRLDCPVISRDERLTSVQAIRITRELGTPYKKAKKKLDALAAELLLQEFLDAGCPGL